MKKQAGLLLCALTIPGAAHAQTRADLERRTANNAAYAEWLGPGLLYSINYERDFGDVGVRVGAGYVPATRVQSGGGKQTETLLLAVPVTVSYLGIQSDWSILEVGGGLVPTYVGAHASSLYIQERSEPSTPVMGTAFGGYRYQPSGGGLLIRAGVSMLVSSYGFLPFWPYVSAGGAF